MRVFIDFEAYSELSIVDVGPEVYSRHASTRILCLSARDFLERVQYIPGLQNERALDWLFALTADQNTEVEAHNVMTERCMWQNVGVARHFWPDIQEHQWRCSAAKAAACALPRSLEDACDALRLPIRKDMTGNRIMKRLSRPAKVTKKYRPPSPEEWNAVYRYNENDTAAEEGLSNSTPELTPFELEVWRADQRMNLRGIPVDVPGSQCAIELAESWTNKLNSELCVLTGGAADRATQRQRVLDFLQTRGVPIYDTVALTLDTVLTNGTPLDPTSRRAIEIMRSIGRSSVTKYQTLVETQHNGRLHDTQMYHGATTGRWTAKRFQPHNLPARNLIVQDMHEAWRLIHSKDLDTIRILYGDPMEFLSHALRGAVLADPGTELYVSDYNAVETRVLFWLADEQEGLELFRNPKPGEDIYTTFACDIYGRHITKKDKNEREVGKRAVLGLGFNMGYVKFLLTCWSYGIKFTLSQILEIMPRDEFDNAIDYIRKKDWARCAKAGLTLDNLPELAFMNFVVRKYRTRYRNTVVKLWTGAENCMKAAILFPTKRYSTGRCIFQYDGERFLTITLPSGRALYYPFPEVDEDGRISFMTVDSKTHQWVREDTYGGKTTENATQATARDLMAAGLVRLDRTKKYKPVMLVHDEIISQAAHGDMDEYNALVAAVPEWAPDLPIVAEGWHGTRYKK